jgi:epoxyqueuosine reductase
MDEAAFHATFAGTPVHRLGWWRLRRNALVVIGNHGDASLSEDLRRFLTVETDPVLREHAVWALDRLNQKGRSDE